jgi:hypothetical protein
MSMTIVNMACREVLVDFLNSEPTLKIILFTAIIVPPAHDSAMGDITEANFDGYLSQNWPATSFGYDGTNHYAYINIPTITFTSTGPTPNNTIIGYALTYTPFKSIPALFGLELFPTPITINAAGQTVSFTVSIHLTQGAGS